MPLAGVTDNGWVDIPVQYATTIDGVSIAYQTIGEGAPLICAAPVPFCNVRTEMGLRVFRDWWLRLAEQRRVIRYDGRGTGGSDRSAVDFSLDAQVRDLEAVANQLGLKRLALLGAGTSAAASVAYAALHPERVTHLLLWSPALSGGAFYPEFGTLEKMAAEYWEMFTETFAHSIFGWGHGDLAHEWAAFMHSCISQEAFVSACPIFKSVDATPYAGRVRARTLVCSPRGLPGLNLDMSTEAVSLIPSARLVLLEGASFVPFAIDSDSDAVWSLAQEFLAEPAAIEPGKTANQARLTTRELEVLQLLASGRTGKEIATALGVSLSTAQRHIANIYTKIGARSRVDAATYALSRGLVDPLRG